MPGVNIGDVALAVHEWPGGGPAVVCIQAMARAIPKARLVVVAGTNHCTALLGQHRRVTTALGAFLKGR